MARQRRVRLRDLIANANATVNQASGQIQRTSNNANEAIDFAEALLAEIMDGVTVSIEHQGEGSFMESFTKFASGQVKEFPIGLKLKLKEGDE